MSLDTNKSDFENALSEMKDAIQLLENCVNDEIITSLNLVISEYEEHLKSDIEDIMDAQITPPT